MTEQNIPRYWKGRISGTNVASILAKVKVNGTSVSGRALFNDFAAGRVTVSLKGTVNERHADLELGSFGAMAVGLAPSLPMSGTLSLDFTGDFAAAEGTWSTDIGTNGPCKIQKADITILGWWRALLLARAFLAWKITQAALPVLYSLALFAVFILSGLGKFQLSYPEVILALVPAPYFFRHAIAELIRLWGITKFGPVELQQPITEDMRRSIAQQVAETVAFLNLNAFLVPRTKLMLHWLSSYSEATRQSFAAFAAHIGVPPENLDNTWNALVASGCARLDGEKLVITDLGRRYVAYLAGQPNLALPLR